MNTLFESTTSADEPELMRVGRSVQPRRTVGQKMWPQGNFLRGLGRTSVLFAFGLTLAAVSACGGGSSSSDSHSSELPAISAPSNDTLAINLKTPAAAPPVGQPQTLDVTTNGTFSTYQWDFGDGTQAAGGARVTHSWTKPGHYIVTVMATDSNGKTLSDSQVIDVVMDQPPAPCSNASAAHVREPTSFDEIPFLDIEKYTNDSDCSAPVSLSFGGLAAGDQVTLVFSNGQTSPTASSATVPDVSADTAEEDTAHGIILEANRRDALAITQDRTRQARAAAVPKTRPAPAVGTQRNWLVPGDATRNVSSFNRDTSVEASCLLPNGRNLIFWRDNTLTPQTYPASRSTLLANAFCGAQGGYARLFALEGAPWGAAANSATNLITDGTYWQDVNVVLVNNKLQLVSWGGVFSISNSFLKTTKPASNEALVVFLAITNKSVDHALMGVLAHESTHLVQHYQSDVARGATRQTWFTETTAMMAEDLLAPQLTGKPYAPSLLDRIPRYMASGGGLSLTDWGYLQSASYGMGMSFGAFLNRRYGNGLFADFISGCVKTETSWECVDRLIRTRGGTGVADEFSRMGASVFSALPAPSANSGYGYPALSRNGYNLAAVDLSVYRSKLLPHEVPSAVALSAAAQTYSITTIQPGQNSFSAPKLVIPPRTVMTVVVTVKGTAP